MGSLNAASVRVGEVFREAIRSNSASVVIVHNHPSGDPTPSPDDARVTEQLVSAGKLLDIEVLDHLDTLLSRTQGLLGTNEKDLNATIRDLRLVMQDMRVVAVHAKSVTSALAGGHPTRLIWVKDESPPSSDAEILGGRQPAGQAKPQRPVAPASGGNAPRKVPGKP